MTAKEKNGGMVIFGYIFNQYLKFFRFRYNHAMQLNKVQWFAFRIVCQIVTAYLPKLQERIDAPFTFLLRECFYNTFQTCLCKSFSRESLIAKQ